MNLWHDSAIVCKKRPCCHHLPSGCGGFAGHIFTPHVGTAPFVFNAGYIGYVAEEMRSGAAKREGAEAQHFASDRVFKQHQCFN